MSCSVDKEAFTICDALCIKSRRINEMALFNRFLKIINCKANKLETLVPVSQWFTAIVIYISYKYETKCL